MDADLLLIHRMKNGDEQAIETFVRRYYPVILRYCRLHIRDSGDAQDMTQETFARFFRTLDRFTQYGKAANYLYVIAKNVCRDYYRKPAPLPMEKLPEQPDPRMETLETQLDVRRVLEQMPEELREVTMLYFFQDLKQKEIARILDIGLPLVKYRIRRAKDYLSEHLEAI